MNPQEIPEAYDVSKVEDIGKLSQGLSLEERKMLREKFIEEKKAIIYLSKSELTDLQTILESENSPHSDRVERVASFLSQQKSEGLSISDVLGEENEKLDIVEDIAREKLFGAGGYMDTGIDISDSAKDHIAVSFGLAVMQGIDTQALNTENVETVLGEKADTLKVLRESFEKTETVSPDIRKHVLDLNSSGEKNSIFMNTSEGVQFFNQIIAGELKSPDDIIAALENANTDIAEDIPENDISALREYLDKRGKIPSQVDTATKKSIDSAVKTDTRTPLTDMTPEEKKSNIEKWKESDNIFLKILAALLELGKELGIGKPKEKSEKEPKKNGETPKGEEGGETTERAAMTEASKKLLSLVDGLGNTPQNEKLLKELRKNPEKLQKLLDTLEAISPDESFDETFLDIFGEKMIDGKMMKVQDIFNKYGFMESLPLDMDIFNQSVKLLEEYGRYRKSDGVLGKTSGRTTWKEWAEKRKQENWTTQ